MFLSLHFFGLYFFTTFGIVMKKSIDLKSLFDLWLPLYLMRCVCRAFPRIDVYKSSCKYMDFQSVYRNTVKYLRFFMAETYTPIFDLKIIKEIQEMRFIFLKQFFIFWLVMGSGHKGSYVLDGGIDICSVPKYI